MIRPSKVKRDSTALPIRSSRKSSRSSWPVAKLIAILTGLTVSLMLLLNFQPNIEELNKNPVIPGTSLSTSELKTKKEEEGNDGVGEIKVNPASSSTRLSMMDPKMETTKGKIVDRPQTCPFRKYEAHRHYHLKTSHDFLANADYIYGTKPFILTGTAPQKLCIDSSSWETLGSGEEKFSDGQNLSIMSFKQFPSTFYEKENKVRLSRSQISPLVDIYGDEIENMYISIIYIGDSQCEWSQSKNGRKPPSLRTIVLILDRNFTTIAQKDLMIDFDGDAWGTKKRKQAPSPQRSLRALDDPRLFFHKGEIWVLYRHPPAFDYDQQTHSRIHFEKKGEDDFEVFVRSNETRTIRKGRNMAMISDGDILKTLYSVDPVSVAVVEEEFSTFTPPAGKKHSNIHGTNGFMIPLHSTNELLGIGHFHRPQGRRTSSFARHGHHYTHAFFTISKNQEGDDERYSLKKLSREFVFPSMSLEGDSDVIQFASGLELVGDDMSGRLLISYGINDCEGAAMWVDMDVVHKLLQPVVYGDEVLNHMMKEKAL